jgi:hypothetical protein
VEVWIAQALLFASDFGAAYNVSMPEATLLIKAGGSAGVVLRIDERTGIRIDAARHYYIDTGEIEAIWSVGFGFTALRPRRP